MKIIVTVEDVGLHPAVARAASILRDKGVVTACSIKANERLDIMPDGLDGMDIGIHLDILRGRPVKHWQHVATLCDENGSFLSNPAVLFERYAAGKVDHVHVEEEWREQIRQVVDLGVKPTHLTSYKHVHGWPSLTNVAVSLAREFDIPWIRKPVECSEIAKLDKSGYPSKFRNVCGFFDREADGVGWTDWMWPHEDDVDFSPATFTAALEAVEHDEMQVIEIISSPGVMIGGDEPIPFYANPVLSAHRWRVEYESLNEAQWLETMNRQSRQLCGFSELNE